MPRHSNISSSEERQTARQAAAKLRQQAGSPEKRLKLRPEGAVPQGEFAPCRFFLRLAACACLVAAFCLAMASCLTGSDFTAMLLSGLLGVLALGVLSTRKALNNAMPLLLALLALLCTFFICIVPQARVGLFGMANALIYHFDDAFQAYVSLFSSAALLPGSIPFSLSCGILLAAASWGIVSSRARNLATLLLFLFAALALFMRLGNAFWGGVFAIAGWLLLLRYTQVYDSGLSPRSGFLCMAATGLGCLAVLALVGLLYHPLPAVTEAAAQAKAGVERIRFGEDSLPQGNIYRAFSMNAGTDPRVRLQVDGTPEADLLLKGFIGVDWQDNTWAAMDHTAYEGEWTGLFSWFEQNGFATAQQRALYDGQNTAHGATQPGSVIYSIDTSNANSKYLYVPYSQSSISGAYPTNDLDGSVLHSGFMGARSYRVSYDNLPEQDGSVVAADWYYSSGNSSSNFMQCESVYKSFVQSHYTEISSEDAEEATRMIFDPTNWDAQKGSSTYALVSRVRTMLSTLATYQPQCNPLPADTNFLKWFLESERAGNSSYFATAATLAFRSQGVPARYVEGYLATGDSLAAAGAAGQNLELTNADAHAWVEIYLDGLGWTPIEVTPGFYTQTYSVDDVMQVNQSVEGDSSQQAPEAGTVAGDLNNTDQQKDSRPLWQTLLELLLITLLIFAIVLALLALVGVIQRNVRLSKREERCASEDQAVAVPALYNYRATVLKAGNIGFDAARPLQCLPAFLAAYPSMDAQEFHRVLNLHQAFAFGGKEMRPNEMRVLRRFAQRMHANLPEPQNLWQRIQRYFFDCL